MVDIRYHLAAIIGVFLALGLGMLIGTQLAEDGTLVEEQVRLVERIEASLDRIRAENRRLNEDLARLESQLRAEEEFVDMAIGVLVAGALHHQQAAVYAADMQAPVVRRVRSVLEHAGADVQLHQRDDPPEAVDLYAPYVLLWSDDWGEPGPHFGPLPGGGVVARATAWTEPQAAAWPDGIVSIVEHVATPAGLLELVESLRDAASVVNDSSSGAAP